MSYSAACKSRKDCGIRAPDSKAHLSVAEQLSLKATKLNRGRQNSSTFFPRTLVDGRIRHLPGIPLTGTVTPCFPLLCTLIPQTFQNTSPVGELDSSQAGGVRSDPVVVHLKLGKILLLPCFPPISTEFHLLFDYVAMQCQLCRQLSFALPSVTWCHQPEMKLFWQVI